MSPLRSCSAGEMVDVRQSATGVGCVMRFLVVTGATRGWCIGMRVFYIGGTSPVAWFVFSCFPYKLGYSDG